MKNGVNLLHFNQSKQTRLSKTDFNFDESDFIVGFVARCTKQKAPLDFLEAVNKAHQIDKRIKGLFIGEGDMDADVNKYISEHHMEEYLSRCSFRTDVPEILPLIDVYCLPSLWEGLSIGLLEAMATGCAIIATPTDGTQEVIKHEQNGMIVPFNSPADISKTIIRLLSDDTLRNKCQINASRLIEEHFNAQDMADAVVNIYRRSHK